MKKCKQTVNIPEATDKMIKKYYSYGNRILKNISLNNVTNNTTSCDFYKSYL